MIIETLKSITMTFLHPASWLWISLWVSFLLLCIPKSWGKKLNLFIMLLTIIPLSTITTLHLGSYLLHEHENTYPVPATLPEHVDGIIVLGGTTNTYLSQGRHDPQLNSNAERLVMFTKLAHEHPEAKLIFSGGNPTPSTLKTQRSEGDLALDTLIMMNAPVGKVLFETKSTSTYENALFAKNLAQPQKGETWLLITTAAHMPRAIDVFTAQNWPVIPYPVDYQTPSDLGSLSFPPYFLEEANALHLYLAEQSAIFYYRLKGYILN